MCETTLCETVMVYYTYACTYTKDLHNYTYPFIEDQRMNVERASVGSRRCDERERVNTYVNKLLFQAIENSPVVLLVSHRRQWSSNWTAWNHNIFQKTLDCGTLHTLFHHLSSHTGCCSLLSWKCDVSWLSKCIKWQSKIGCSILWAM